MYQLVRRRNSVQLNLLLAKFIFMHVSLEHDQKRRELHHPLAKQGVLQTHRRHDLVVDTACLSTPIQYA